MIQSDRIWFFSLRGLRPQWSRYRWWKLFVLTNCTRVRPLVSTQNRVLDQINQHLRSAIRSGADACIVSRGMNLSSECTSNLLKIETNRLIMKNWRKRERELTARIFYFSCNSLLLICHMAYIYNEKILNLILILNTILTLIELSISIIIHYY